MQLLTIENAKTVKGEVLGYLTGILYLAPAQSSGVADVCPMSTAGCRVACLNTAGMAGLFPKIIEARIRKTQWLTFDREGFVKQLKQDIRDLVKQADKLGLVPAIRVNGTSDLPKLAMQMAREFPNVQFYDYTKIPRPWQRMQRNYHITFSLSENNFQDAWRVLQHGMNVAVVFDTSKGDELPMMWRGVKVVDGDSHDLRFLDAKRSGFGVVIGLRAKGKAKKDRKGFVQIGGLLAD